MFRIGRDCDEGAMMNEARARLIAGGGTAIMGPMAVPGGMWIVLAEDPQGAMFALVGRKRSEP